MEKRFSRRTARLAAVVLAAHLVAARAEPPTAPTATPTPGGATTKEPGDGGAPVPEARRRQEPREGTLLGSSPEATLREYRIRLAAHRRELLEREAALEAAQRRIEELTKARADEEAEPPRAEPTAPRDHAATKPAAAPSPPTPSQSAPEDERAETQDPDVVASLRQELDTERENRATLEKELERVLSDSRSPRQMDRLAHSLEGARAEILVLTHRLEDERRMREALEVTIERARRSAGVAPGPDWVDRFEDAMTKRREEAERLQRELADANEAIVALRGKLEAAGPATANDAGALQELAAENERLHRSLEGAERANSALRTKAELASRLAELLYAQPQN